MTPDHTTRPDPRPDGRPDHDPAANGAAPRDAAGSAAPAGEPGPEAADPRLATLEAERDDLKDRLLRTLADMENLRRRTEREVADGRTYAVTNFARDMLTVADNVRRALESVPAEAASVEGPLKALVEGIELTERELGKTLERHGVRPIEAKGQRFDPQRHQAMFEVPDPSAPSGTVVQVVQSGYALGERVLRPALVGVARGGPKPEPKPEA